MRGATIGFVLAAACALAVAQQKLPYRAIDHPQFVAAAQATFLHAQDRVMGVDSGGMAKAYPAAIVAQHGVVNDMSPDGPIAITW